MSVLATREVQLFGQRYRVKNGVRRSLVNQTVPFLNIGDTEGAPREEKASRWTWSNTHGGLGRYRYTMGADQSPDQFFDSSLRTDTGILTLLPNPTQLFDVGATVTAMCEWGTSVYIAGGTQLRRVTAGGVAQFFCTTHGAWETAPVTAGHAARTAVGTVVSFSVFNGVLVAWCGAAGCTRHDGATTFVDAAGAANDGLYAVTFDSRHVVIESTGVLKTTTDLLTFTAVAGNPRIYDAPATSLVVAVTGQSDPQVHIGTTKGLYVLDLVAGTVYPLAVTYADAHPDNGRAMAVWNSNLHYAKGGNVRVLQVNGKVLENTPIGPNADDGLPAYKVGRVTALEASMEHLLLCTVDAGGSGTSGVYLWRGSGWHTLVEGSVTGARIRVLQFTTAPAAPRLYYAEGSVVWWIPWSDTTSNPIQQPAGTYRATGKLVTPWFGTAELRQLGLDQRVLARRMSTTETALLEYAVDDDDTDAAWFPIGPVAHNGASTIDFNPDNQLFRTIRFRLTLARGTDALQSPRLSTVTLRWTPLLHALFSYSFQIDASNTYAGLSPHEIELKLQLAADAGVGLFSHRPSEPLGARTVRIEEMRDLSGTGSDARGEWVCTVSELTAALENLPFLRWDGTTPWTGEYAWAPEGS
jgi:hypothetical protein